MDPEITTNSQICCNSRCTVPQIVALFLLCFLSFGSYFCYDNPAALEDHLKKKLNLTTTQYSLLYSMYSWPNVILCFIGGFLIDRVLGIQLGTNIYTALALFGQLLFACGVYVDTFWVMIMGRFIFGIGSESLAVAQNFYSVLWFHDKQLNMVFGLQQSLCNVGSTVDFFVMDLIYRWINQRHSHALGLVLFIAASTCLISMACGVVLGFMYKKDETTERREEVVRLVDVKDFRVTFWLTAAVGVGYEVAVFTFIGLSNGFFTTKFHLTDQQANDLNSSIYLIAVVACPLLGFLIDKIGRNILFVSLALFLSLGGHGLLAFTSITPILGMTLIGSSYACVASTFWTLVSLIIPRHQLGTAYGVFQAIQNLGLAVFSVVAGSISQKYNYLWLEVFYICQLLVALLLTSLLWWIDRQENGILNMTSTERIHLQNLRNVEDKEREELVRSEEFGDNEDHAHIL